MILSLFSLFYGPFSLFLTFVLYFYFIFLFVYSINLLFVYFFDVWLHKWDKNIKNPKKISANFLFSIKVNTTVRHAVFYLLSMFCTPFILFKKAWIIYFFFSITLKILAHISRNSPDLIKNNCRNIETVKNMWKYIPS